MAGESCCVAECSALTQHKHSINLQGMNGQLEFFNVDEFEPMSAAEHFMCTDVEWDPTGRFVATSVGHIHQMENGFIVWLFNGTELHA